MELVEWLQDARGKCRADGQGRRLVDRALALWAQGIIPSQKLLNEIREQMPVRRLCQRLGDDGSCSWLRKWGAQNGLAVPPIGERALCPYVLAARTKVTAYEDCPGFRKG